MGQPILSSSRAYFNVVTIHGYGIGVTRQSRPPVLTSMCRMGKPSGSRNTNSLGEVPIPCQDSSRTTV